MIVSFGNIHNHILTWFPSKYVMTDGSVAAEAILFRWLSLISLIVFSNVGSGSIFSASKMFFILSWSKLLSKDVVIVVIGHCDGSLTGIPLIDSVSSERHSVFELILTSSSSICYDSWCCCSMKSIIFSSGSSNSWSDLSNLVWSLVSNQSSENNVSEVRVTILFSMFSDETFLTPYVVLNWTLSIRLLDIQSVDQIYQTWPGV